MKKGMKKDMIVLNPFWKELKPKKGVRFIVPTNKWWKLLEKLLIDNRENKKV